MNWRPVVRTDCLVFWGEDPRAARLKVYALIGKFVRPEIFELQAFWIVASYSQNPSGLFGVAFELRNISQLHTMIPN
jgi:hypothetical protein